MNVWMNNGKNFFSSSKEFRPYKFKKLMWTIFFFFNVEGMNYQFKFSLAYITYQSPFLTNLKI